MKQCGTCKHWNRELIVERRSLRRTRNGKRVDPHVVDARMARCLSEDGTHWGHSVSSETEAPDCPAYCVEEPVCNPGIDIKGILPEAGDGGVETDTEETAEGVGGAEELAGATE